MPADGGGQNCLKPLTCSLELPIEPDSNAAAAIGQRQRRREMAWPVNNAGNAAYVLPDNDCDVMALSRGWSSNGLSVGDVMEQYVWSALSHRTGAKCRGAFNSLIPTAV